MDREVYRIEIPIEVHDRSAPALAQAQQRVTAFERSMQRTERQVQRMNRTRLRIVADVVDRATPKLRAIASLAHSLGRVSIRIPIRVLDLATAPLRRVMSLATSTAGLLGIGLGGAAAVQGGIVAPLRLAGNVERVNTAFRTFLGNQQAADQFLRRLEQSPFARGFGTGAAQDLASRLLPNLKDADLVLRTLNAFGDAAALTGVGVNGMSQALVGFNQISAVGTLSLEELRQVTENLGVSMTPVLEELGLAQKDLREIGNRGIPASKAMDAILRALERPVSRGGFLGGAAIQANSLFGLFGRLNDIVQRKIVIGWGTGLQSVLQPRLAKLVEWFDANAEKVELWRKELERAGSTIANWVMNRVDWLKTSLADLTSSREWQEATSLGDKIKLVWQNIIVEPFNEWWGSEGRRWVTEKAEMLGKALGSGLGGIITGLFGLESEESRSQFTSAGATAGSAFAKGFLEGFNAPAVARSLVNALPAPIGQGDFGTGLTAVAATVLIGRALGGGWLLGKGGGLLGRLLGRGGASAATGVAPSVASTIAAEAGPLATIFGPRGEVLSTVAQQAGRVLPRSAGGLLGRLGGLGGILRGGAGLVGGVARRVPLLGLLFAAGSVAMASPDQRLRTLIREGTGLAGSIGGGLLGSLLGPVGTVAGGAAGFVGGQALGDWLADQLLGPATPERLEQLAETSDQLEQIFGPNLAEQVLPDLIVNFERLDRVVRDLTGDLQKWAVIARGSGSGSGGGSFGPPMNPPGGGPGGFGGVIPGKTFGGNGSSDYAQMAREAAMRHGIDPNLFERQMRHESAGFDPDVIAGRRKSSAGAEGIAQIMRKYHPGVDPLNPQEALDYAARLMASHLATYGNYRDALVAYNGGGGAVAALRAGNPYRESQAYTKAILGYENGGTIYEPILGVGLRSGRRYAFGEGGAEDVVPRGGGGGMTVVLEAGAVPVQIVASVSDPHALAEQIADPVAEAIARRIEQIGANIVPGEHR